MMRDVHSRHAKIIAPHYVLGEQTVPYQDITSWQERAAEFSMPGIPEIWGWGVIRRTTSSFIRLAIESAKKSLAEAATQEIDTLIFCSTSLPDDADKQTQLLYEITEALQLNHAEIIGITLGRCTNLLKGLRLAQARIASGQSRQILVIASDCMRDEGKRLENFALFSDGAASCLVCDNDDPRTGFEIIASAEKQDAGLISQGLSSELAKAVNRQIFTEAKTDITDISRLFHGNVYLPLCNLKERQAGYSAAQLYTDNIVRFGHCFSADPLINFIDAIENQALPEQGLFQLAVSIPGARASVLLQKRGQE